MGKKAGESTLWRNDMIATYRPTHGGNPVKTAFDNGVEFGKATCHATGEPFVPKEYDRKLNLLCYVAYRNGVAKGRLYGRLQGKGKVERNKVINGNGQVLDSSGGDRDVRHPVPATEIEQRPHPAIRAGGGGDPGTGSGECEQGSGEEGGEGVGEVVPTA